MAEAGRARRNVLVTGVGAIIGYGVVNSLRLGRYALKIVGLDIYAHAVGQYWCDAFERSVPVADPGYLHFLRDVIARHRIDLVIPGIEQDVTFLSSPGGPRGHGRAACAQRRRADRSLRR